MLKTKVKYLLHDKKCNFKQFGNWIDLRSAVNVDMKPNEFKLISLGISIELPKYFEMNIVPRSSTFKNYSIIQSNMYGVIDSDYCGMKDIIKFPAISLDKHVRINAGDRICQFRINISQDAPWYVKLKWTFSKLIFEQVDVLHGKDRGGFGKSGIK